VARFRPPHSSRNLMNFVTKAALTALLAISSAHAADITGAGSSFVAPVMSKWADAYNKATGNKINYQSIGSSGGMKQIEAKTVDFGASDAPFKPEELDAKGLVQFPVIVGGIVPVFNLPGIEAGKLRLNGPVLGDIFLGKITKWNDPAIAAANPGVKLPDLPIAVVHRADSSGTTFVFTQHLSATSPDWKSGPGTSKAPNWPTGVGAKGNEGVTSSIAQTPGAIGYVEFGYAKLSKLPMAMLENKSGTFVEASTASAQAALAGAALPENLRLFLPDPDGQAAYPIVTYTWLLAYRKYDNEKTAAALKDVVKYCLSEGQKVSEEMGYVPLPQTVVDANLKALENVR
jgi:phosphate transport system substrate-binding protein